MRQAKKFKYRGEKSEILDSIIHEGYEIKSLKHGNTGHILYKFPSKAHDWEMLDNGSSNSKVWGHKVPVQAQRS